MYRTLFHIYGPFDVNSFGLMIAIGLIIFAWLVQKDPKTQAIISRESFIDVLLLGIVCAVSGGRLLYLATNWNTLCTWTDFFSIWNGGLSILGGILTILIVLPLFLHKKQIPILPFFDLVAIYAPLLHAIARLGCFLAGCCHGTLTTVPWSITYTHTDTMAPLGIPLHPSQLYSVLLLSLIFIYLYTTAQYLFTKPGQLISLYIILGGSERFVTDFFRGDREFLSNPMFSLFSTNQWIALGMITGAAGMLYWVSYPRPQLQRV